MSEQEVGPQWGTGGPEPWLRYCERLGDRRFAHVYVEWVVVPGWPEPVSEFPQWGYALSDQRDDGRWYEASIRWGYATGPEALEAARYSGDVAGRAGVARMGAGVLTVRRQLW